MDTGIVLRVLRDTASVQKLCQRDSRQARFRPSRSRAHCTLTRSGSAQRPPKHIYQSSLQRYPSGSHSTFFALGWFVRMGRRNRRRLPNHRSIHMRVSHMDKHPSSIASVLNYFRIERCRADAWKELHAAQARLWARVPARISLSARAARPRSTFA